MAAAVAANRAVEITIGQHCRSILSTHLDARRDPSLSALNRHLAPRARRTRKYAGINSGVDQRSPGLARPLHDTDDAVGEALGQALNEPSTRTRRELRRLQDDAIAREQRRG